MKKRTVFLNIILLIVLVSTGCSPAAEPYESPSEEETAAAVEAEPELEILFPQDGQIVWGPINVLLSSSFAEISTAIFSYSYEGDDVFIEFGEDDGSMIDSEFIRDDRFATWDTTGLPRGNYVLRTQIEEYDGESYEIPEVVVTVVDAPEVEMDWMVVETDEEFTRIVFSAYETSNPDLYQLAFTWSFSDGTILEGDTVEFVFASNPACHQALLDDYQMLQDELPDEVLEIESLMEEVISGPCIEPVTLTYATPEDMEGAEDIIVSLEPGQVTEVASIDFVPALSAVHVEKGKVYAGDIKRFTTLLKAVGKVSEDIKAASRTANKTKKEEMLRINILITASRLYLKYTIKGLKEGNLDNAIKDANFARVSLRLAVDSINVKKLNELTKESEQCDLLSAGVTAAWGRLKLVSLIGEKADEIASPEVAESAEKKIGGVWTKVYGSQYVLKSKRCTKFCQQFIVIQKSDRHQDDSVILHELGHHAMYKGAKAEIKGGNHSIKGKCPSTGLAYSEGWANFFQSAILQGAIYKDAETGGDITYDLEKDPKTYGNKGKFNEGAVSAILWDLYDGSDGIKDNDKDGVNLEFKVIWEAMLKAKTGKSVGDIDSFAKALIEVITGDKALKDKVDLEKIKKIFTDHGVVIAVPATPTPTITLSVTPSMTPTITITPSPSPTVSITIGLEYGIDRKGMDYTSFDLPNADPELCMQACLDDANCVAFTYVKPGEQGESARCWLKSGVPEPIVDDCCISGVKPDSP